MQTFVLLFLLDSWPKSWPLWLLLLYFDSVVNASVSAWYFKQRPAFHLSMDSGPDPRPAIMANFMFLLLSCSTKKGSDSYVPLKHANYFLPQGSDGWLPLRSIVADRNPFKGCPQIEPLYKHATHGQRTLLNLVPMEDVKRRWIPMKFLHTLLRVPAICLALHSNEISKGQLSQLSISDMSSAGFNMLRHATLNMLRPSPAGMLGWVIAVFSTCIPGIPNAWLHAVKIFAPCSGVLNKTAIALDFDTLGSAMESDKSQRIPKVVALSLREKQLQQEDPKQVVKYKYL